MSRGDIHSQESSRLPKGQGGDAEQLATVSMPISDLSDMLTKGGPVVGKTEHEDHDSPNHAQSWQEDGWSNLKVR